MERLARWCLALLLGTLVVVSVSAQELIVGNGEVRNVSTENEDVYYSSSDAILDIGGGQVLFKYVVGSPAQPMHVTVSTCTASTFNTAILLLDNSVLESSDAEVKSYNRYDPLCVGEGQIYMRSTLEYQTDGEETELYFLLTGWIVGDEPAQGTATVSFREEIVQPISGSWGLDRIRHRKLESIADGYQRKPSGGGVFAYIIDSGIRKSHVEFRQSKDADVSRVQPGQNFVELNQEPTDCNGHGTHVAALLAGLNMGVTSKASVIPVKVLNCKKEGSKSKVLKAIEWILEDLQGPTVRLNNMVVLPVVSKFEPELNARIEEAFFNNGVPVIAASGNYRTGESSDSCLSSPGSLQNVITVSASTGTDTRAAFSKYGRCTNLYAPGSQILSAYHTGDNAYRTMDGTSQAVPFVAGAVALLQSINTNIRAAEINDIIVAVATKDVLKLERNEDDANVLAYVRDVPVSVEVETPPPNMYHFYFIFRHLKLTECSAEAEGKLAASLSDWLNQMAVVHESSRVFNCELDRENIFDEAPEDRFNFKYEMRVKDVKAAEAYEILEKGILDQSLQNNMTANTGYTVESVVELPWVVDSRGYKFWAAPVLPKQEKGLSTGAIVGIVLACITVLIAFAVSVLLIIRWMKSAEVEDEIEMGTASAKLFEDEKSPRAAASKGRRRSFLAKKGAQYLSQGPEAFVAPLNGVSQNLDSSTYSLDSGDTLGQTLEVESLAGGEGVINFRGNDGGNAVALLGTARADSFASIVASNESVVSEFSGRDAVDGPLRTLSFGSEAAILGGGISRDISFRDEPVLADDSATRGEGTEHIGAAGGGLVLRQEEDDTMRGQKLRTDSFGDIKLDEDMS